MKVVANLPPFVFLSNMTLAPRSPLAQEPVFVARPGGQAEDDGWLLFLLCNSTSHMTDLVILDAQCLTTGPVARIRLPTTFL